MTDDPIETSEGGTTATATSTSARDAGSFATYVPHDLKYHADFEDSLMQTVLNGSNKATGIRIIADNSDEAPVESVSMRAADVAAMSLPTLSETELPLPLTDPRRIFASSVPGVKLTHPAGYIEGGPGLDPDIDTFSDDFVHTHSGITTEDQLREAIDQDVQSSLQTLRERMQARQKAKEKNEAIEKDLRSLIDQHSMELKIQRRMLEEHKAKMEAKEKKRQERGG